ncbi:hypothetical protein MYX06_05400 [Patescibacteria group bacterium AH-259-L05]|nr:hypothetical protein [Patescibacteria group bacterium AH-259-L05]
MADISDKVLARASEACKSAIDQKIGECSGSEGWLLDVQVGIKNVEDVENEENEVYEAVCKGGCPGKGAGNIYPLRIKGETIDIQSGELKDGEGGAYEIFCNIGCSTWECVKEPPPKTERECAPHFASGEACLRACDKGSCDTIGEVYPYCYKCRKNCDLDVFSACVSKCVLPQECVANCPFLPVECPPGEGDTKVYKEGDTTIEESVTCAELDQTCSYGCLDTARACLNSCLSESNCKLHEIPPELTPNPDD